MTEGAGATVMATARRSSHPPLTPIGGKRHQNEPPRAARLFSSFFVNVRDER